MTNIFWVVVILLMAITGKSLAQSTFFKTFDSGLRENDRGWSLQTAPNGYLLATLLPCSGSPNGMCMGIGKFDLQGTLRHNRLYEGLRNCPNCLVPTPDGQYILAGDAQAASGDTVIFVMKIDANGDSLWTKFYDFPYANYARSIQALPNGDLVVQGDGWPQRARPEPKKMVFRTDGEGNVKWQHTYQDTFRLAQYGRLVPLRTGEFLMCYDVWPKDKTKPDCMMAKLAADGRMMWSKRYFRDLEASAQHVLEAEDGRYLLIGSIDSFIPRAGPVTIGLTVTDTSGNIIEKHTLFNGHTHAYLNNIAPTPDGYWIGAGGHFWEEGDTTAAWLLKFGTDGKILWQRSFIKNTYRLPFWFEDVKHTPHGGIAVSGLTMDISPNGQFSDADAFIAVLTEEGCLNNNVCDGQIQHIVTTGPDIGPTGRAVLDVSPNPASNLINIQTALESTSQLTISDPWGKTVFQKQLDKGKQNTTIEPNAAWPDGLYWVSVRHQHACETRRLIIQKHP